MTKRLPCPPAPGPLEAYATQFDPVFASLAQRRGFRAYLEGLLLPRDRNKTLTALVGTEPVVGAQHPAAQGLQWFLSESTWDADKINQHRLQLLLDDPATAPNDQGVLVIDDSGDRKAGSHTAHVARQWLGSVGKTDNGIVAVSSLWPTSASTGQPMLCPIRQHPGARRARPIPPFGPSHSRPSSSSRRHARRGSGSARWWRTASTVISLR
jgi:DDE superfamily endonuclease